MKKKTLLLITLILIMICAMSGCEGEETAPIADSNPESQSEYSGGTPWAASVIKDNLDSQVDIKDDYYMAVNSSWIMDNEILPGYQTEQYMDLASKDIDERIREILSDEYQDNHDAELVQTYYNAFLNWDDRNATGTEPLTVYLDSIENISSTEDIAGLYTDSQYDIAVLFPMIDWTSSQDVSRRALYLEAPDMFLDDPSDYDYLDGSDEYVSSIYDLNKNLVVTVLLKCGYSESEAEEIFDGAIEFEGQFAKYCYSYNDLSSVEYTELKNTQVYSNEEIKAFGNFSMINRITESLGYPEDRQYVLYEKIDYFENFDSFVNDNNIELIKDYLIAHAAADSSMFLDRECFEAYIDMKNEMYGVAEHRSDEDYALEWVKQLLEWPLSKLYCERYVTAEDRQRVYDVASDIIGEYKLMIEEEDFLSEETKLAAINKLDNLVIKCMYPDEWEDYGTLDLSGSLFDMNMQINDFIVRKQAAEYSLPVNREKFSMTPITPNMAYEPDANAIYILPGLVGDVLYNKDMPTEEMYGKLGFLIGHEISHSFDPLGSNYDEIGNYRCWWNEEDKKNYDALCERIAEYYGNIEVWEDLYCNGEAQVGEACSDMAGLAVILRLAEKQSDFDYDLFFRSYAELHAANWSPNYTEYCAQYDEHPLPYLRVNVSLAQFDEFCETYGIEEGDGMYIAPEDRVKIW